LLQKAPPVESKETQPAGTEVLAEVKLTPAERQKKWRAENREKANAAARERMRQRRQKGKP
jgi:hypothetical protein